ncbi:MAG TPA: hypothetical protein VGX78_11995 [Pirellulales bacterium]|jgi:hypothetical protein|nr:hypothetical protein [Pirellulales bacterium]
MIGVAEHRRALAKFLKVAEDQVTFDDLAENFYLVSPANAELADQIYYVYTQEEERIGRLRGHIDAPQVGSVFCDKAKYVICQMTKPSL